MQQYPDFVALVRPGNKFQPLRSVLGGMAAGRILEFHAPVGGHHHTVARLRIRAQLQSAPDTSLQLVERYCSDMHQLSHAAGRAVPERYQPGYLDPAAIAEG